MILRKEGLRSATLRARAAAPGIGAALTVACAATSVHPVHKAPDRSSDLSHSTFVSDGVVRARGARLPEGDPIVSSPVTSTLIAGATDAVLVDPPLTIEQTRLVGDWIGPRTDKRGSGAGQRAGGRVGNPRSGRWEARRLPAGHPRVPLVRSAASEAVIQAPRRGTGNPAPPWRDRTSLCRDRPGDRLHRSTSLVSPSAVERCRALPGPAADHQARQEGLVHG
jgi:hypothetical protein